ncbi:tRNA pseudouridine(55) synthase TruB [Aestuariivirga litoralis]|uniref:tRNA pseudouridine(55) synthase TruB n=1 Tax=Aestuariivirga litoralis TaxID=2650924 RepID=UPI0018C530E6|nr:tRNA pseudouridine(55) synthase TruB [Aestuariivirga litoralis]MBG1232793.1 tRNA pseudouridine(55) synthase TruB [Aestuariivirga litoralis]
MTSPTKKPRLKINGWLALDKPYGMTSTQALGKVRWLFNADKAGHGGTLDPLATGLLPIALGEATKTVNWAMDGRKIYRVRVAWGSETTTDDLEGTATATSPNRPNELQIASILPRFTGEIMQAPPAFSAIKIDGERAYDLARAGEAPVMVERPVFIEELKLNEATADFADFEIVCGKGTYIRSLARDIGRTLGCYGHVAALRRTQVGGLTENQMISLEKLEEMSHMPGQEALQGALFPIETVLDGIPALAVMENDAARLRQGQKVLLRGANAPVSEAAVLVRSGTDLVGLGEISQGALKIKRLFNL